MNQFPSQLILNPLKFPDLGKDLFNSGYLDYLQITEKIF